ncbi:hypothetical protein CHS0354_026098 [Potamilus streckersoni]|uniref:FAD dependent oxidoreductase domain-containing protein n=1 Tax=Potamilus streckersoni TaxID=2493646 RepID=A0AAE0S1F5_9BIVA|nr:hypothetical protein CHS0354_026098 [Potamilus streckersoni]
MVHKHDVAIIGGGVVGCSVLFELTNRGFDCVLLEKNESLVAEASCGNSGMLHTGFDAPLNSIELDCIRICQRRIFDVLDRLHLPCKKIGATMVAWKQEELTRLSEIEVHARQCEVSDVVSLSMSQLYQREPHLSLGAYGALLIPAESVVDPWLMPVAFASHSKRKGAEIKTECLVTSCQQQSQYDWQIETTSGIARASCVINCAGLYGDIVDKLGGFQNFQILPRKGQYLVYEKRANSLLNSSILPIPSQVGKGVIIFRSVYDNVLVGPTSEEVTSRLLPAIDNDVARRLTKHCDDTIPGLKNYQVVTQYAGVRPATQTKDYIIKADRNKSWITIGGIRSTGVSGCLGIAEKVYDLLTENIGLDPSRSLTAINSLNYRRIADDYVVIDGAAYKITHPITLSGMEYSAKL